MRAASEPVKLAFQAAFQIVGMQAMDDMRRSAEDNIRGWAQDIFEQTGYFRFSNDPATADYRLIINVRDNADPNLLLAFLCGLSLFTIPAWASDDFVTQAELVARAGERLGERRIAHRSSVIIHLLLLPAMPFALPKSTEHKMWAEVLPDLASWTRAEIQSRRAGASVSRPLQEGATDAVPPGAGPFQAGRRER